MTTQTEEKYIKAIGHKYLAVMNFILMINQILGKMHGVGKDSSRLAMTTAVAMEGVKQVHVEVKEIPIYQGYEKQHEILERGIQQIAFGMDILEQAFASKNLATTNKFLQKARNTAQQGIYTLAEFKLSMRTHHGWIIEEPWDTVKH